MMAEFTHEQAVELIQGIEIAPSRNGSGPVATTERKSSEPSKHDGIVKHLEGWGYDLWLNELDDRVFNGSAPLSDVDLRTLRSVARDHGYGEKGKASLAAMEDSLYRLAYTRRRNPPRDLLAGLQWDGRDHIAQMAAHLRTEQPPIDYADGTTRPIAEALLQRWLVGAVAKIHGDVRAMQGNAVLVLVAGQGEGKSHWARWLPLDPDWYVEGQVRPDEKDNRLRAAVYPVWEIGELGATTSRQDVEGLKAAITATTVTERPAYGRFTVTKPCISSYIGTVNDNGGTFLRDATGNRRFWVLELVGIDHAYTETVDKQQVWAQAMHLWRENPKGWQLAPEERLRTEGAAERHTHADPMIGYLEDAVKEDTRSTVKASQLLDALYRAGMPKGHRTVDGRDLAAAIAKRYPLVERSVAKGVPYYRGLELVTAPVPEPWPG
jgi:predicted P-loop ATPase